MNRLPVLASYAYVKNSKTFVDSLTKNPKVDLLIDSGAHTAYNTGTTISMDEYCEFLKETKPKSYFTLDVIGDAEKSLTQYLEMKERGFSPIPIFTRGAPIEHLEIYAKEAGYIALGGIFNNENNAIGYVVWFMKQYEALKKRFPKMTLHWLGWSEHNMLLTYRPTTFDNSSWSYAKRFRYVAYPKQNRVDFFYYREAKKYIKTPEVRRACEVLGFEPAELLLNESWTGERCRAIFLSIYTYLRYSSALQEKIGSKLYLVTTTERDFLLMRDIFTNNLKGK